MLIIMYVSLEKHYLISVNITVNSLYSLLTNNAQYVVKKLVSRHISTDCVNENIYLYVKILYGPMNIELHCIAYSNTL